MIRGKVTGQVLQLAKNTTVSDSKNYISARFVFSLDWLGLTKTVHFRNGENQADVTLVDAAVSAKGEAHGVLGDGLGRVCWNTGDLKAEILSNRHVDGIEASAAHENELDAEAGENLEGHGASVGINEGADGVIATGEGGSHRSKVGLDEVDLDFRVILELLGEGVLVVARGTIEQNLHRVSLRMSARNYARVNPTLA